MRVVSLISIFTMIIINSSCTSSPTNQVPQMIGEASLTRIVSGEDAQRIVAELHSSDVATAQNIIAYYGNDEDDILYITWYKNAGQATQNLGRMVDKMSQDENSPFYHLMPLSTYNDEVYMTIGMGAIHYIYASGERVLWYQTQQSFGMELPESLVKMYPVK